MGFTTSRYEMDDLVAHSPFTFVVLYVYLLVMFLYLHAYELSLFHHV
jgi:hypothetical protein